ncbi:MAG: 5-bromo-4-chloroindolyl phosphate hydrolysis family protein, partial [Oscillospiraceae bacterium]|nr:5-bromo-4-chloroindolyl phosphate hydrolysis family protein [Oscillospiraceae bacterium]
IDKMIRYGNRAISEMKRLNESIRDEKVSADIDRLEDICGKIFTQVKADPSRLPQIRKFMDYYLPTTLKLLNAYDRMGAQGVSGENINATMQRIENMMGTIVQAFEKQLDSLFGAEALDISTDITVLENLMRREGLVSDELHDTVNDSVPDSFGGSAVAGADDIRLEL